MRLRIHQRAGAQDRDVGRIDVDIGMKCSETAACNGVARAQGGLMYRSWMTS